MNHLKNGQEVVIYKRVAGLSRLRDDDDGVVQNHCYKNWKTLKMVITD